METIYEAMPISQALFVGPGQMDIELDSMCVLLEVDVRALDSLDVYGDLMVCDNGTRLNKFGPALFAKKPGIIHCCLEFQRGICLVCSSECEVLLKYAQWAVEPT